MSELLNLIPVMEIEGNFYRYRRFGIDEIVELLQTGATLLTEGFERLHLRVAFLKELVQMSALDENGMPDAEVLKNWLGMIVMAFGSLELKEKLLGFVARNLRKVDEHGHGDPKNFVTREELSDPDLFPAYSLVQLVLHIVAHPDFEMVKLYVTEGLKIPFFRQSLENVSEETNRSLETMIQTLTPAPSEESPN